MAIEELWLLIQGNKLKDIVAVATSYQSKVLARQFGVNAVDLNDVNYIDLAFDGADEVWFPVISYFWILFGKNLGFGGGCCV